MKLCRPAIFVGVLLLVFGVATVEVVCVHRKIKRLENAVFRQNLGTTAYESVLGKEYVPPLCNQKRGASVDTGNGETTQQLNDSGFIIHVDDLTKRELELYTVFNASLPEGKAAGWTLKLMHGTREIESYENIKWMLEGRNKQLFTFNELSRTLRFVGRSYQEDGVNDYVIAIAAWDKTTYKSHEIVVTVEIHQMANR